jgi:phosphate transport system substrate-binding protein
MLICALWLSCFQGASPAAAQGTVGPPITICSKNDQGFAPQSGTLKRLDEKNFIVITRAGEQAFNKDDFVACQSPAAQERRPQCPAGQAPGVNGECACPSNLTMNNGRCVASAPAEEVAPGKLTACNSQEAMTIQGSSTIGLGIMPALIKGFADASGFRVTTSAEGAERQRAVFQLRSAPPLAGCFVITVLSTGSDTGKEGITDRVAQIAVSSRYYEDGEIEGMARAGKLYPVERSQVEHVIALDAVGIVVNKANPVASLELCQIAQIFGGKIRDWRDLKGRPGPINVHVRTTTSGTFEAFKELVMDNCGVRLADNVPSHGTYPDLLKAVASDEASIGFAPAVLVDTSSASVKALGLRAGCGIEQTATPFSVKSEDYPLARRLYVFTPVALAGLSHLFENFIFTDGRVDDLVNQSGAIDQKIDMRADDRASSLRTPETAADPASRDRFSAMTRYGRRLSITYRFALGSEKLDSKARQDIVRLAAYLRSMRTPPTIFLAGFTDDIGSIPANLVLATKRAEEVRRELLSIVPDLAGTIQARGFGKILPVNCNDTQLGKAKNRRVEVFVAL